ncbi:Triose-phosphate Transporter [Boothiomyces sp. JEL0838]|nr:Triose-phosphate Transporter [Boothiomyces sp. JEL0838]
MVKSAAPVFVLLFAFLFGLEKPSWRITIAVIVICAGVGIMVANETKFDAFGYAQIQIATVLSGFRWAITQVLLENEKMGMNNPLATNLFIAPIIAVSLFFSFITLEGFSALLANPHFATFSGSIWLLLVVSFGGCIAFTMVNFEFALISTTSVVTLSIAGIFKEILTLVVSALIFKDKFTSNMIFGLILSLVGIGAFNYIKILSTQSRIDSYEELDEEDFEMYLQDVIDQAE